MPSELSKAIQKGIVIFISIIVTGLYLWMGGDSAGLEQKNGLIVSRVIDGDTIELNDGSKVRYIGVDTPETKDPRKGVECYGKKASERNEELVLGKEVVLEKDISDTDRYGRLLRYVYVNGEMINAKLIEEGYAHASSYPPDVYYQDEFRLLEAEARASGEGLWSACD